jgi:predicted patatin/cPLA2 family phospholipase
MSTHPLGMMLTGGGARGPYQAGAVAIAEITSAATLPFPVLSGASAGGLDVAYLASHVTV